MGILFDFINGLFSLLAGVIGFIVGAAIMAVGLVVELVVDVVKWIDDSLRDLLDAGATDVHVVLGEPLADYIRLQKEQGTVQVDFSTLQTVKNSVINVATDSEGNIKADPQMIKADKGVSEKTKDSFKGKNMMTIKITQ